MLQTFYATTDQRYLAKSVLRRSEYTFFRDDLFTPYCEHMASHAESMLVRICEFIVSPYPSIGKFLGAAPSHHIVMDNVLYGQAEAKRQGGLDWEHWDLKPTSYFFPERDIAEGMLTFEATKSQLADKFHGKILSRDQADEFFATLERDTDLLVRHNAVDYSLFLVRIKTQYHDSHQVADPDSTVQTIETRALESRVIPQEPPFIPPAAPSWITGIPSSDGEHIFRATVLDFFWAKHKIRPRVMTALVKLWNTFVYRHGPMSITTTSDEYRQRFIKMCKRFVEVREE